MYHSFSLYVHKIISLFDLADDCYVLLVKEPENIIIFSRDGWFIGPYVISSGQYVVISIIRNMY